MPQLPKLDTSLSEEGRWCEYYPGIEVKIARAGNTKARDMYVKLGQRNLRRIQKGSPRVLEGMNKKVVAAAIVKDWRGMTDEEGKEIPYSKEQALELFNDPQYADFYEFCRDEAGMDEEYLAEQMEEAAGN